MKYLDLFTNWNHDLKRLLGRRLFATTTEYNLTDYYLLITKGKDLCNGGQHLNQLIQTNTTKVGSLDVSDL